MCPIIAAYPPAVQNLAQALDQLLLKLVPAIYRTGAPGDGTVGYQRGPGYKGTLFTMILSKQGVKLGIPYGASLVDPHDILRGSGKVHRFFPITTLTDLDNDHLRNLIHTAVQAWEDRSASHT